MVMVIMVLVMALEAVVDMQNITHICMPITTITLVHPLSLLIFLILIRIKAVSFRPL